MSSFLALVALAEAATGLALALVPRDVTRVLFGAEVVDLGVVVARVAGISLIALGRACLPWRASVAVIDSLIVYGALVASYLAYVGIRQGLTGPFLWPA